MHPKGQNALQQFPRIASPQQVRNVNDKSVTSWRGQKSVASCPFPKTITTTCCQQVRNKLATSPFTGKLRGNVCNSLDFRHKLASWPAPLKANSPNNRAYNDTELADFFPSGSHITIACTHFACPQRDVQAELGWVARLYLRTVIHLGITVLDVEL